MQQSGQKSNTTKMLRKSGRLGAIATMKKIREWSRLTGEKEFYLSYKEIRPLAQYVLDCDTNGKIIINRSHISGKKFIHRICFQGLTAISVSDKEFVLI